MRNDGVARRGRSAGLAVAAFLVLPAVLGCSGPSRKAREITESNLKPLAILYGQFLSQHRGQPPKNEAEFRGFVKSLNPAQLAAMTANREVDSLFISPRDQKPYVVVYGKAKGPAGPGGAPVIAYEQEGKDGRRFVASTMGAIEEVDDATFRQMVPSAKN